MNPDFLNRVSRNFEDSYGVKLGKSGALFLSVLIQNGKENNENIKLATEQIKENIVSKPIHFKDSKQAFFFGLGITIPFFLLIIVFLFILYLT